MSTSRAKGPVLKSRSGYRWRRLAVLLVVVGAVILASASPASAHDYDDNTFTVDIDGLTTGAAPDSFAGDADAVVAIKITNKSWGKLGSANVTVPTPFSVVSAPNDAVPGGPVIELRNLNLAKNAFVTVNVTVNVRTCAPATPAHFAIVARKNSDYSGSSFSLTSPSDKQVNVIGKCALAFVTQPKDAEKALAITSVAFNPGGAPISAEVRDAGNTGRAISSTASIVLSVANPSVSEPGFGGTTSASAVAGLASFTPGPTIAVSAFDYTLTATSAPLTPSSPSTKFDIVDDQVSCAANAACNGAATANKNGTTASATFGSGASSTNLTVTIGAADAPVFECSGYPKGSSQVSQFGFTGDLGGDRVGTFSVTIPNASWFVILYQVCWASPVDFYTKFGNLASSHTDIGDGTPKPGSTTGETLKVGLLPNCKKWWWNDHWDWDDHFGFPNPTVETLPCITSRTYNWSNRSVTIEVKTTGADPWRY
jgi:hypothetical protein